MRANHFAGHFGVLPAVGLWGEDDSLYFRAPGTHCVPTSYIQNRAAYIPGRPFGWEVPDVHYGARDFFYSDERVRVECASPVANHTHHAAVG